jgi:fructosamine-3-kinase
MPWKDVVLNLLEKKLSRKVELASTSSVGGGSINDAFRFNTNAGSFFIKKNSASRFPQMFEKEILGLDLLASAKEIPVPEVVGSGVDGDESFLILRFIESARKSNNFWENFGKNLANLHKHSAAYFGLDHDNYIGSLFQSNQKHASWAEFFREERLAAQVKLARDNGKMGRETVNSFERFYLKIEEIFPIEPPALIHGDLWGGNFMVDEKGEATIIDPAVYFGHREMDLGMSQLFGGFSHEFYEAYYRQYPLEKGWQNRMDYCNLYPLMVHVNLFGGGYLGSVNSILRKF